LVFPQQFFPVDRQHALVEAADGLRDDVLVGVAFLDEFQYVLVGLEEVVEDEDDVGGEFELGGAFQFEYFPDEHLFLVVFGLEVDHVVLHALLMGAYFVGFDVVGVVVLEQFEHDEVVPFVVFVEF
jgi:hypothetical protein